MRGERFTSGLAFILAGLGILFVTGAVEAEIVLTSGLGTPSYLGATDLVRLSAVPWGLGLLLCGLSSAPWIVVSRLGGKRSVLGRGGLVSKTMGGVLALPPAKDLGPTSAAPRPGAARPATKIKIPPPLLRDPESHGDVV